MMEMVEYTIEEHENFLVYTLHDFISEFGGLIGLFMGFSILSLGELIFNCVFTCCNKREIKLNDKNSGKINKSKENLKISTFFFNKNLLPGIDQVNNKNTAFLVKIFWILAIFVSISGLFYYFYFAFVKLNFKPEMSLKVELIPSRNIPFPSITLCTTFLPLQLHFIRDYFTMTVEQQNMYAFFLNSCSDLYPTAERMKQIENRSEFNLVRQAYKVRGVGVF
jgi:hypothetical protein